MKIHSIESLAALDGEGVRYALFLSGCPLKCAYCHNPDTWASDVFEQKTPVELYNKIKRYKPYFAAGGGGVTFSGGEPLLQAKEIVELASLLNADGINYALDTSGNVNLTPDVCKCIDLAELVILDLKFYNAYNYKTYTTGDFGLVKEFFDYLLAKNKRVWVRTVIVPDINDTKEHISNYCEFLKPYLSCVEKYELLGFHTMGFFKYDKLMLNNPLKNTPALKPEKLKELQAYANDIINGVGK